MIDKKKTSRVILFILFFAMVAILAFVILKYFKKQEPIIYDDINSTIKEQSPKSEELLKELDEKDTK